MADKRPLWNDLRRILVFRIGHLGDTVVALPAFWTLRNSFPAAEISLLTDSDPRQPGLPSPRNVLPSEGLFDRWISYPSMSSLRSQLRLAIELRRQNFDAVFYLMTRNRTASQIRRDEFFFRLAGVRRVFCTNYLRENGLSTSIPAPTPEVCSEAQFLLDCLRSEGIESDDRSNTDLALTVAEKAAAEKFLSGGRTSTVGNAFVAVAPGSKWESKIWPEDRFREVVRRLISEFDVVPVVLGGSEDQFVGERLVAAWGRGLNGAGRLTIRESAAVLERCRLYLGNDTGVMHLASAVGIPCIAIFAAVDWIGRWSPFGSRNKVFRSRIACEGCHLPVCPYNNKCLDAVAIEEVLEACRTELASHRPANA